MLEKIYIIPHIWTRKLQEAILFSWPHENTYPYTQQCLAVSYQKISKDQPPSYQDEKGWEMVFRCMQPLWVATPACWNGSTFKCKTTGITGYLPMPPKGLPTARPTGNPPRTVTWEMTEGKSMEILENFWFFAIFQPKSLGRFGKIWTDWQDLADQFRFGFWFGDWCRCIQEKNQRTHKFRLELPWVAYVTTKSPIGTGRPSRVVEAAEPVFVYCLPLPIRKENNLTNPCQIYSLYIVLVCFGHSSALSKTAGSVLRLSSFVICGRGFQKYFWKATLEEFPSFIALSTTHLRYPIMIFSDSKCPKNQTLQPTITKVYPLVTQVFYSL